MNLNFKINNWKKNSTLLKLRFLILIQQDLRNFNPKIINSKYKLLSLKCKIKNLLQLSMRKMKNNTKQKYKVNLQCQKIKSSLRRQAKNLTNKNFNTFSKWYLKKMIKSKNLKNLSEKQKMICNFSKLS